MILTIQQGKILRTTSPTTLTSSSIVVYSVDGTSHGPFSGSYVGPDGLGNYLYDFPDTAGLTSGAYDVSLTAAPTGGGSATQDFTMVVQSAVVVASGIVTYVNRFGTYAYGNNLADVEVDSSAKSYSANTPGVEGEYTAGSLPGPRTLSIEGIIVGDDPTDPLSLRQAKDAFYLAHTPGLPSKFYIHGDRYMLVECRGVVEAKGTYGLPYCPYTATLYAADPFWYAEPVLSASIPLDGVTHSIATGGTRYALPTIAVNVSTADGEGYLQISDDAGRTCYVTPPAGYVGTYTLDCRGFRLTYTSGGVDSDYTDLAFSGKFLRLAAGSGALTAQAIGSGILASALTVSWNSRYY